MKDEQIADNDAEFEKMEDDLEELKFATELGLSRRKINVPISGLSRTTTNVKWIASTMICNGNSYITSLIDLLVIPKIADSVPQNVLNIAQLNIPKRSELADPNFDKPGETDMLIGAELFFKIIEDGKIDSSSNLLFQSSVFGGKKHGKTEHRSDLSETCWRSGLFPAHWPPSAVRPHKSVYQQKNFMCGQDYKKIKIKSCLDRNFPWAILDISGAWYRSKHEHVWKDRNDQTSGEGEEVNNLSNKS
ncbi:hypothetical protein AVEN_124000-1 [Araneus ventricosus]|uniref:Peptidase aspartic putative domain-containing protein n=1 Tax=Araneus ventricosus TaxID=182803 RepID=A0A4Y2DA51_ARAVE|nr:hypothetical protein AVEN_124000-1 [Araneus ventricosus]